MSVFPNITAFKERLLDGGARPSLFQMMINWPEALRGISRAALTKLPFQCRISEIPGSAVNPIIVKYAGREIKYAGQRVYQNLIVTIINDESYIVRRALEAWSDVLNTHETNISALGLTAPIGNPQVGYAADAFVDQYAKVGYRAHTYRFIDLFPINISPIPLDWSNDATIEEYTCEFAYQYWEISPVNPFITF